MRNECISKYTVKRRKAAYNTSYLKFKNKNRCYTFPRETCVCSKHLKTNQVYIHIWKWKEKKDGGCRALVVSLIFYFKMRLKKL